jgi:putative thiamine transport system ATP-binding protein
MNGALVLENVSLELGGKPLFAPLSLSIAPGEIVTVMGPSGAGKSSLLAHLCGALPRGFRANGRVLLDGRDVAGLAPEKRGVGILFQDDLLFPHLTVEDNLSFGIPKRIKGVARASLIETALAEAELPGMGGRDPATLSGGERARVALMRALLAEPKALLLDEPFNRLDRALKARIRNFVLEHARAAQTPTLLVTHDLEDGVAAGGPVVELAPAGDAGR